MNVAVKLVPAFRLPLDGNVLVGQSGADVDHNHHAEPGAPANQRHAYDLDVIDDHGRLFVDDGDRPEEWVGWGTPIRAAADGVVVAAVDGQRDIGIGERPSPDDHAAGNRVAIRHDDGSVTWYAHLRRGSVEAALLGTRVEAGTELGRMGNSGNSTSPHLHVHRQVGGVGEFDPAAVGVELAFTGAALVGAYRFDPARGFVDWRPATSQPAQPHVARRGQVLVHRT